MCGQAHTQVYTQTHSSALLGCFFRLSLVVASRSSFLVVVQGLFTVVSSLVAEHGLQGVWAP